MAPFEFVLAGRYKLVAPLGEGGMASVYRGRDLRLNREVAIKILHDNYTREPDFLRRFQREAETVASLSHPNIVPVYDVGDEQGSHFIVMELVRGRTLKDVIASSGPLQPARAALILRPVLDALGYAHQRGLVHRDVKPQNILLAQDGTPRLADFGIAHLTDAAATRTAAILGSAEYLSPEQSRGEEASPRSDIYACGVVLYEMLAGSPPFRGGNALAIANQHLQASPPPLGPEVPAGLRVATLRALEKEPERRFSDAAEFAAALADQASPDETSFQPLSAVDKQSENRVATPPVRPLERMRLRRSPRKVYLLAAVFAVVLATAAYAAKLAPVARELPSYPSAPYAAIPALLVAILAISWLSTRSWMYTIDGGTAVVQWGVFGHRRFGLPLRAVVTFELRQSVLDRLLGVGTVELCARDDQGDERHLIMEDLPSPRRSYDELVRLVGASARRQQASAAYLLADEAQADQHSRV